jgi:DNA-binding response OmpR family regulator
MHALIIEDNKLQRESLTSHLQHADHRVTPATRQAAALAVLERESPDVILVGWNNGASDIVRRIRAQEIDAHSFVIAILDKHPAASIPAVFQAGVDDFVRVPLSREELLARVEAPTRFRKWASIAAKLAVQDTTGERDLRKLKVFRNMGDIVAEDLSTLVGRLTVAEGFLVSGELHGASIPMSIASERAEIRVSIVVEKRLLKTLAGILLCDENSPPDAVRDMIREIANTAGGSVKRAASLEQLAVTTGLPVDQAGGVSRSEMTRCWTATMDGSSAQIGIIGEVNRRANQRVPLSKVHEGMVMGNDLRNQSGALIMPSGTRLTMSSVTRLVGLLGPKFVVDVLDA